MAGEGALHKAFLKVAASAPQRVPVSTYRLQFYRGFRFADATAVVSYLDALGITDIYSSPYFRAKEGSTHGYDIIDHQSINPEIGTEEEFGLFSAELKRHGMGLIMDIVPNHMSIASSGNSWWQDVLENGPSSSYAPFFDIDWKPVKEVLEDKVIIPVLGGQYGNVLENQELTLSFENGAFFVNYHDNRLPVDPSTYTQILTHGMEGLEGALGEESEDFKEFLSIVTALGHLPGREEKDGEKITERLREKEIIKRRISKLYDGCPGFRSFIDGNVGTFNGSRESPESFDLLDRLLDSQVYRLAYWQVATEEINYRRFFDINDLAAIRTEDAEAFYETHRMVLGHIGEKIITGLRVDHPDGLHNPDEYLMRLQEECLVSLVLAELGEAGGGGPAEEAVRELYRRGLEANPALARPFYIVGEKILTDGERIPEDWPVYGTTGYVFMNAAGGLFVKAANAKLLTGVYSRFIRKTVNYPAMVYEKKKLILESSMSSEINVLAHNLNRISEGDRHYRDFTLNSLTDAIVEAIAFFPVYRTYIDDSGVKERDLKYIETAVARARRHRRDLSGSIFDFLRDVLALSLPGRPGEKAWEGCLDFTMKFQQLTGPVMAKGLEDTVFYNYNRLASLNEVGGNPDRFGVRPEAFHGQNIETSKHWPHSMVATSTHDSKRSEDVRARINVISELPVEWREFILKWARENRKLKTSIEGVLAPDRNDEYLIYQTLLGSWPMGEMDGAASASYRERIRQYVLKAAKEAKANTTWISPNADYEEALLGFVDGILSSERFLVDFRALQGKLSRYGMFNSLSQTLLKITSPGVPDFYQGTELWNLNLVDPDNRRPVDYTRSRGMLDELIRRDASEGPLKLAQDLLHHMEDGRIKLYLTWKALNFRKANSEIFSSGKYVPLHAEGGHAHRVVAFEREAEGGSCITAVPAFLTDFIGKDEAPLGDVWSDTCLVLPEGKEGAAYKDVFTGRTVTVETRGGKSVIPMRLVLSDFPVALLEREQE